MNIAELLPSYRSRGVTEMPPVFPQVVEQQEEVILTPEQIIAKHIKDQRTYRQTLPESILDLADKNTFSRTDLSAQGVDEARRREAAYAVVHNGPVLLTEGLYNVFVEKESAPRFPTFVRARYMQDLSAQRFYQQFDVEFPENVGELKAKWEKYKAGEISLTQEEALKVIDPLVARFTPQFDTRFSSEWQHLRAELVQTYLPNVPVIDEAPKPKKEGIKPPHKQTIVVFRRTNSVFEEAADK